MTFDDITQWLDIIGEAMLRIVFVILVIFVVILLIKLVLKIWDFWRLFRQKVIYLELTPPSSTEKRPEATRQLFSVIYGLGIARTWVDVLFRRKSSYALEVISSREQGVRYIVRVPEYDAASFRQSITSYVPDVRVEEVSDFLRDSLRGNNIRVSEFRQTGHYAFPLQMQDSLEEHDPVAYLTGLMTQLEANEVVIFQMILAPAKVRSANMISRKILRNEELIYSLNRPAIFGVNVLHKVFGSLLFSIIDGIADITTTSSRSQRTSQQQSAHQQQVVAGVKPARTLSTFEQQLVQSVHHKVSQSMFKANIRTLVIMKDKQAAERRTKGIRASLASFNVPKYQALKARADFPLWLRQQYRKFEFRRRLPTVLARNTCLLSTSEVADLYHFPFAGTTNTDNLVKSHSRTLPAPISMKNNPQFDVVLGENRHHGSITPIGLTEAERQRHVYIIGGTGNGKTTLIQYSIVQDIQNGKGLAIVDPHGDMVETLLRYIPEERIDDVIYFNPADLSYPIGLNLLELPEDATGDELLLEKDFVTETVVSIFRKIFSDDGSGGHRIEYMLRNAVQTAFTVENATLFTLYELINDPKFRKQVVGKLKDEDLKNFWKNEFGKAGSFQQVKMASGITAKIGRFLRSEVSKRVLEQPKSTINFEEILDGKILICNLSKGMIGEDTSELFGISILAKLQLAALRRARISQDERKPFYLYVDEFQNFATVSFIEMLSEARKYKLFLTMAEQSTSQQDEQRLVNIILANVGTVICFRSGSPADEQLLLPLFSPHISEGEIANLPSYNFYMRVAAVRAQEPFSGETVLLKSALGHGERVIAGSRKRYATSAKKTQEKIQSSKTITSRENPKRVRNISMRRAKSID